MNEQKATLIRKNNMKLYPIYKMLGYDLLFYYGIRLLFLTQVKGITDAQVVLASSFYALFSTFLQIPLTLIVSKIGKRKGLIIGNLLNCVSIVMVIFCPNFMGYLIEEFISAIGFTFKSLCESSLLSSSIPETKNKGDILSNIEGSGYAKYCYISAAATVIAGLMYEFNPYIPLVLCLVCIIFGTVLSIRFVDIEKMQRQEMKALKKAAGETVEKRDAKYYIRDLLNGFKFIFKSNRLRALLLMIGVIGGLLNLFSNYQVTLLKDLDISAFYIGIILAILEIIVGISASRSTVFNKIFKNKSLTIIALVTTVGAVIAGGVALFKIPFGIVITIILTTYVLRMVVKGIYEVLKKRYLTNFSDSHILPKILSANGFIYHIIRAIVELIGAAVLGIINIKLSFIALGIFFTTVIILVARYMKPRVGLKPEEYKSGDIKPVT